MAGQAWFGMAGSGGAVLGGERQGTAGTEWTGKDGHGLARSGRAGKENKRLSSETVIAFLFYGRRSSIRIF
jgi:hypothetical protein